MCARASCWPTHEQELLLKASLLRGDGAIAAWHDWKSIVHIDDLDPGSFRMLPLLYQNLKEHGIEEPVMDRCKEVYRLTWSQNQLLFHGVATLLCSLHDAGIRTMVLKGAALVVQYYQDYGLRPMVDFDILVPTKQAIEAMNVLVVERGWKPKRRSLEDFAETSFSVWHAEEFKDAAGRAVDLHWHMLLECCYPGADDDFWENAVPILVSDVATCAPSPTDQLLHLCAHGAKYRPVPQFRWVADAVAILSAPETEIDWARLVAQAEKRRLILPLRNALQYLWNLLGVPVPSATLAALHDAPVSRIERIEYRTVTHSLGRLGKLPTIWTRYARYSQGAKSGSLQPKLLGFLRYLQYFWNMEHMGQVLRRVVSRGWQKVRES